MYSIIIPCYRSSQTIGTVVEATALQMETMGRVPFEFVLVNDCSPDNRATYHAIKSLAEEYSYVRAVDLAKNVGQHNAIMAGLRLASGDVFIGMDDDMQTRPSELPKMFEAFDEDYDVVYGVYPEKKESFFRLLGSWVNKMCSVVFLGRPKDLKSSSFWIMRRHVRDSIIEYQGAHAYMLGLILRSTSSITSVTVQHFEREIGKSGYTFKALLRLWSNIIGFTVRPLHIALQGGTILSIASLLFMIFTVVRKLLNPEISAGWSSLIASIYFSLGVLLLFLGLIGEYVGRTYMHINHEPQYVIREVVNGLVDSEKKIIGISGGKE